MLDQKSEDIIDFDQLQDLIDRNLTILDVLIERTVKKIDFFLDFFTIFLKKIVIKLNKLFLS